MQPQQLPRNIRAGEEHVKEEEHKTDDKLQESFTVIRVVGQETSLPPANPDDSPISNSLEDLILKNSDEKVEMEKTDQFQEKKAKDSEGGVAEKGEIEEADSSDKDRSDDDNEDVDGGSGDGIVEDKAGKGGAAAETSGDDNAGDGIGGDGNAEDGNGNAGTRPSAPVGGLTVAAGTIWGRITTLTIPLQRSNTKL